MTKNIFRRHGEFCATHPWEVIVVTLTLTACMLTVDRQHQAPLQKPPARYCQNCLNEAEHNATYAIVTTLVGCFIVLYGYYRLCHLDKLRSKYILGIAGLFTAFSSFIFISAVINFLRIDVSDLKYAVVLFLLLIDLSKAAMLAEFALSASDQDEIKKNIARGMSVLGPKITLDTIVETLLMGVGTWSDFHRLEMISYIACLSAIVNYIVFMTFYPACLSLILELSSTTNDYGSLISKAWKEEDHKSNPIVQRVKIIMSAGLTVVHMLSYSRLSFREDILEDFGSPRIAYQHSILNNTDDTTLHGYIRKWVTLCSDHIMIFIIFVALIMLVLFENIPRSTALQEENPNDNPNFNGTTEEEVRETEDMPTPQEARSYQECLSIYQANLGFTLTDDEIVKLVKKKDIPSYSLEEVVKDAKRGMRLRRRIIGESANLSDAIKNLPCENYDYSKVWKACCENVIGYLPVPVGIVGPLKLDGELVYVPMATTEGCLVASASRGCRVLMQNGVTSKVVHDGMTRAPVVRFPSLDKASEAKAWMENPKNFASIKTSFDSSSRYARLTKLRIAIAGRFLYIRFEATTGDAMGMNMLSLGTQNSLEIVHAQFPEMEIVSLSGNYCTDKKPSAINWIEGRGKSVACEAIVPAADITKLLKTNAETLVDVNVWKNLVGSAMAGSIGGQNAHAANIVTAIYIASGQDPAQNVSSSNCITLMERTGVNGDDLYISCTMPSIEVGTVGGGTVLPAQAACLQILNVKGGNSQNPGNNAKQLAKIVCATVLAGELSLIAALAAGHLVRSHLAHNRSSTTVNSDAVDNVSNV